MNRWQYFVGVEGNNHLIHRFDTIADARSFAKSAARKLGDSYVIYLAPLGYYEWVPCERARKAVNRLGRMFKKFGYYKENAK